VTSVAPTEVTPARVALLKSIADLAEAKRQTAEARARLAEAVGLPLKALEQVELSFDLSIAPYSLGQLPSADLRQHALQDRPDLRAALAEYAAAQSALQLEIARQYPDVHLGTGYQFDQGDHKWALGVTAEIPVLNHNEGPIAEALAKRAEVAARFLELQAKVVAEMDRAFELQSASQEQLRNSELVVQTQRQHLDALQAAFKGGLADALEVNGAQIELSVGLLARLDAQFRLQQAIGQLEEALRRPFVGLASIERGREAQQLKKEKP